MPARGGRVDAQGNYHQKPTGFPKFFPLAFVFILLGFTLCTLTSVEAGIDLHLCVSWQPVYGGASVCATGGEVGGSMMVKLVVVWSAPVISVSNGWIEVKENAGHENRYAKWEQQYGSSPPADAPCRVPGQNTTVFQQTVPAHWWIDQHNGPWTIKGGCSYVVMVAPPWPPRGETRQAEAPPITVSLRELTVQNVSPKYLIWSPDYPASNQLTIQYSLDSVQQTPVDITIKILPLSDNQNPDPIKTVVESRDSPGGPYTYNWDGTMDTSVPPGQPAPKGIYPFEISVAQPAPPCQQDQKKSAYLTISDLSIEGLPCDATDYVKVKVKYTLSDVKGRDATACWIRVYNPRMEFIGVEPGEPGDATLGSHEKELTLLKSAVGWGGLYTFVVRALDDDDIYEKDHRDKLAIEKGKTIYSKILQIPYHSQDEEAQFPNSWCGEASSQMWIEYEQGNATQTAICQRVLADWKCARKVAEYDGADSPPPGYPCEVNLPACRLRGLYAIELADMLNKFLTGIKPSKYQRAVFGDQDSAISDEAYHIAYNYEPSAAVTYGPPFSYHWMLPKGCVTSHDPTTAPYLVFGLWVADPGPVGQGGIGQTVYVSSDVWKVNYFYSQFTDRDGERGFMHVEDPVSSSSGDLTRRPRGICQPPTKPHGTPVLNKQVKEIAEEGLKLHLLYSFGPMVEYLEGTVLGEPVRVKALEPPLEDYYLVPCVRNDGVTAVVIVNAQSGQFHGASFARAPLHQYPETGLPEAVKLGAEKTGKTFLAQGELVWKPCNESTSPYLPFWEVRATDGTTLYVREDGKTFEKLTIHNCVGVCK